MTAQLPLPIDRDCLFDLLLFILPVNATEVTETMPLKLWDSRPMRDPKPSPIVWLQTVLYCCGWSASKAHNGRSCWLNRIDFIRPFIIKGAPYIHASFRTAESYAKQCIREVAPEASCFKRIYIVEGSQECFRQTHHSFSNKNASEVTRK